jgi:hypothetical protein
MVHFIVHLAAFLKGLILTKKIYNLDYYSVGCCARSLRSNHVPHLKCGRLYFDYLDCSAAAEISPAGSLVALDLAGKVVGLNAVSVLFIS